MAGASPTICSARQRPDVEVAGSAYPEELRELVSHVDAIAEIPNSLRRGTPVTLRRVDIA